MGNMNARVNDRGSFVSTDTRVGTTSYFLLTGFMVKLTGHFVRSFMSVHGRHAHYFIHPFESKVIYFFSII